MTVPLVPDMHEAGKNVLYGNIFTCCYLQLVLFYLYYFNKLYRIAETDNVVVIYAVIVLEIIKYVLFGVARPKLGRSKDNTFRDFLKILLVCASMVVVYYVTAVLFGALLWSEWTETFMFSLILTSVSVLPLCLNLGPDVTVTSLTSLNGPYSNSLIEQFLFIFKVTLFGTWLGAVVIPLDWDRPWQVWPIPCCIGSFVGCIIGNLYSVFNQVKFTASKHHKIRKHI